MDIQNKVIRNFSSKIKELNNGKLETLRRKYGKNELQIKN